MGFVVECHAVGATPCAVRRESEWFRAGRVRRRYLKLVRCWFASNTKVEFNDRVHDGEVVARRQHQLVLFVLGQQAVGWVHAMYAARFESQALKQNKKWSTARETRSILHKHAKFHLKWRVYMNNDRANGKRKTISVRLPHHRTK